VTELICEDRRLSGDETRALVDSLMEIDVDGQNVVRRNGLPGAGLQCTTCCSSSYFKSSFRSYFAEYI